MDTQSAVSFAVAAPFIAMAMSLITQFVPVEVPVRWNPLISFGITLAWGFVLWFSDYWNGDLAVFIVTTITVTYAVIGLRSQANQIPGVNVPKLSGQTPLPPK